MSKQQKPGLLIPASSSALALDVDFTTNAPTISKKKVLFYSLQAKYSLEKVDEEISGLQKLCAFEQLRGGKGTMRFMKAIRIIEKIVYKTDNAILQQCEVEKLVICCVALLRYACDRVHMFSIMRSFHLHRVHLAEMAYYRVLWLLTPEKSKEIINALFQYLSELELWQIEMLCLNVIYKLVLCHVGLDLVLKALLQAVEYHMAKSLAQSRCILRVMHELLQFESPRCSMNGMVSLAEHLLDWLYKAVCAEETNTLKTLQRGLVVCTRRIFERFDDETLLDMIYIMLENLDSGLSDEQILEYGGVLEYAVLLYRTGLFSRTLRTNLVNQIFLLMTSSNRVISLTACRILERFLDRHNNLFSFVSPVLYLQNLTFDIVVGSFRNDDKLFLLDYRSQLHDTLLQVIRVHGHSQVNLESVNTILSLLIVEIPCGFTAAFVVCIAMDIQAEALGLPEADVVETSWRHATVVGIMSLVCWTHHAVTLYKYVESVITKRGRQAPHLNPPLKLKYAFASHHVLWSKPELFFEPWELRYSLWKHFRCKTVGAEF